ncbi:MAG: FAD-dependent oxidoreductase [Solirubrobacteraceae bacterium]|nr:FAD-dependent oxidoreductase [Solirubrobacteraceae bacterium]
MSESLRLSRRTLLATASASALTATVASAPASGAEPGSPGTPSETKEVDVAIIGAGLTGLNAARALTKAGKSVHVVEADDRPGGRVWTVKLGDGTPINWGATFVGPQQTEILALAKEVGVGTYPTWNRGKNVQEFNGQRKTYTGTVPQADVQSLLEVSRAMSRLNGLAGSMDPAKPWEHPQAAELDRITAYTWIRQNTSKFMSQKLLDLAIPALFSVESWEVSALHLVFYVRSAGTIQNLLNVNAGAQESQFDGGSMLVCERVAEQLGKDAVTYDSPARRVVTEGDRTTVHADGVTVVAKRVIVAVPPPLIPRISYEPLLSGLKDQICQHSPMGSVGKAVAVYDTPWWRAKGYTGQITSDVGPVQVTFDISPGSGTPGVIMGFIDSQAARDWNEMPLPERRAAVLDQFARWFGEEARTPRQYLDVNWDAQEWHRGCPVAVPQPGTITGYKDALRRPEGALHFACTETATAWSGYMDGAVRAGKAVAAEVEAAL